MSTVAKLDVTFIYVLKDPITGEVRYVGKTDDPKHRIGLHLIDARRHNHRRACWIRSLMKRGLQPQLEIVDEVPMEYWQALEAAYIAFYRELGYRLVNGTPGGEGFGAGELHPSFGTKWSVERAEKHKAIMTPELRAKMSAACKGRKRSPESIAKTAAFNRGKKRPASVVLAVSRALKGRPIAPETRTKISAKLRGTKASAETRAKLSAAHTGRPCNAKTRQKISAAFSEQRKAELRARITGVPRSMEVRQKIIRAKARGQLFLSI